MWIRARCPPAIKQRMREKDLSAEIHQLQLATFSLCALLRCLGGLDNESFVAGGRQGLIAFEG